MKFCIECGSADILHTIPEGDNRHRYVCNNCQYIYYQNPRIIAGTLPYWGNKVLLCRRAIEPRRGYWNLPAGFLENGESLQQGAERETLEEAEARIRIDGLYTLFNLLHIHQVHVFYRGELVDGAFGVGPESLECALFSEEAIPWEDIAFPTVKKTLKYYFDDRRRGLFEFREQDIHWPRQAPRANS